MLPGGVGILVHQPTGQQAHTLEQAWSIYFEIHFSSQREGEDSPGAGYMVLYKPSRGFSLPAGRRGGAPRA